jgi:hypothetical protein
MRETIAWALAGFMLVCLVLVKLESFRLMELYFKDNRERTLVISQQEAQIVELRNYIRLLTA